jgi:hypothetical protein
VPSLTEQLEPDLDQVLDFRFATIEAELFVVFQHLGAVERQLPQVAQSERERLEQEELAGVEDQYEYHEIKGWIDEFVEEVLPRLHRSPLFVELWAVFESGIVEIAEYLQKEQGHSISVHDLRSNNDFERAKKYYEHVLHFPLVTVDDINERLKMLLLVRNAVAHCNGRIKIIKEDRLRDIRKWEEKQARSPPTVTILVSRQRVESMAQAVKTSLEDLIKRVKENTD